MRKKTLLTYTLALMACFACGGGIAMNNAYNMDAAIVADAADLGELTASQAINDWIKDATKKNRAPFNLGEKAPATGTYTQDGAVVTLTRDGQTYTLTQNCALEAYGNQFQGDVFVHLESFGNLLASGTYAREEGDIITIEGRFTNGTDSFTLKKVTIEVGAGDKLTVVIPSIDAGAGYDREAGVLTSLPDALLFGLEKNEAPYREDWNIRYRPMEKNCVKVVRGGQTIEIGHNLRDTITKTGDCDYRFECWVLEDYKNFQDGDQIIIEGKFSHAETNTILDIDRTVFTVSVEETFLGTRYAYSVNAEKPVIPSLKLIEAGAGYQADVEWKNHLGFYFSMDPNEAPYSTGYELRYKPMAKNTVLRYRNGIVNDVSNLQGETIVKYGETNYFIEGWAIKTQGEANETAILAGDMFVVSGIFVNTKYDAYFNIDETVFIVSSASPTYVYTVYSDYRGYLADTLYAYNLDKYGILDQIALAALIEQSVEEIQAAATAIDARLIYEQTIETINGYVLNEDALEELAEIKQNAKAEITEYVQDKIYDDAEQLIIDEKIAACHAAIDEANNTEQITQLLTDAKMDIDKVVTLIQKREALIQQAVANGNLSEIEQYLETYNVLSLRELSLGDTLTFKQMPSKVEFENVNIKTDTLDNNTYNMFAPAEGNTTGSAVFQFTYRTSFVPDSGNSMVIRIKLGGIEYYGYLFQIGTGNGGVLVDRLQADYNNLFIGGTGYVFEANTDYKVELGAIDLKDSDRTWLFLKVNGEFIVSSVCDTMPFSGEPRVDFRVSYNSTIAADTVITLSDIREGVTAPAAINGGRFAYSEGHSDSNNGVYVTLRENALPYAGNKSIAYYPLAEDNVQLIRGGETSNVGNLAKGILYKYTAIDYYLDLVGNGITPQDGDIIVVKGQFVCFNSNKLQKAVLEVREATFIYNESVNEWEQVLNLWDMKENALDELAVYEGTLSAYDEADRITIQTAIDTAKAALDSATTIEDVEGVLADAKAVINGLKTTFAKYQAVATAEVNGYKADVFNSYREKQQGKITALKETAVKDIAKADSTEAIDAIVAELKAEIDSLATDAQLTAQELADAKTMGAQTVKNCYGALDFTAYDENGLKALNEEVKQVLADIKAATSIEAVEDLVKAYTAKYGEEVTEEPTKEKGCGSVIGGIAGGMAILGLGAVAFCKRKETSDETNENE